MTDEGNVVTRDGGLPLEPLITVPADTASWQVTRDGFVTNASATGSDAKAQAFAQVFLAVFPKPQALKAMPNGLFEATAEAGCPVVSGADRVSFYANGTPAPWDATGAVVQGRLETPRHARRSSVVRRPASRNSVGGFVVCASPRHAPVWPGCAMPGEAGSARLPG